MSIMTGGVAGTGLGGASGAVTGWFGWSSGQSPKRMKAELDRCIILCQNCHSILHADECAESGTLTHSRI